MYDSVLVPTDGSETAEAALDHAVGVAQRNDATLHTVYATELGALSESLDEDTLGATLDRIKSAGEEAVHQIENHAQEAEIETESAVMDGAAADVILQYVEENDIDIVVMATHGRTGEERRVIGSVTEQVVRSASVPVLTVTADQ